MVTKIGCKMLLAVLKWKRPKGELRSCTSDDEAGTIGKGVAHAVDFKLGF